MTPPRHVVVCGAGVMGAATAYFLAQRLARRLPLGGVI